MRAARRGKKYVSSMEWWAERWEARERPV